MKKTAIPAAWAACLLLSVALPSLPTIACAQAWLPDPGRGSVFIGYEYGKAYWTLFPGDVTGVKSGAYVGGPGNKAYEGDHYDQIVNADLDYGIRRGLAASFRLIWVASMYDGLNGHRDTAGQLMEIDNGDYHGSFQDAEIALRLNVLRTPFLATPFVGYLFPVALYEGRGHAATGHHLREFRAGAALARNLHPLLPDAYAQVTYTYSAAERQFDHSIHRNGLDMELGYFLTPRLTFKGTANWLRSSGGIDWYRQSAEFIQYRFVHDQLANDRSWRLAGGFGYVMTPAISVYVMGFTTVGGASTHAMNGVASGFGLRFAAPWAR